MLEDLGHRGIPATGGKEALQILRQREGLVDLVISDYAMPAMTGLQLADAIKTEWPKLPIIIASGFAEMGPEARSRLPELSKPFSEADLAQAILKSTAKLRENGRVLKFPASSNS